MPRPSADALPNQYAAWLQSALIRLEFDPGRIDDVMGDQTQSAMREAGVDPDDPGGSLTTGLKTRFSVRILKAFRGQSHLLM